MESWEYNDVRRQRKEENEVKNVCETNKRGVLRVCVCVCTLSQESDGKAQVKNCNLSFAMCGYGI